MILSAKAIPPRQLPRPKTLTARAGLAYQHKFSRELALLLTPEGFQLSTNSWFEYIDSRSAGPLICAPDILVFDLDRGFALVIEVKQTWTPLAIEKLRRVYCPVVSKALDLACKPLVVCKILSPSAPKPQMSISASLLANEPLVHWSGRGPVQW